VYVAAFAPDEGESIASFSQPFGATPALGELRPIADGFLLLSRKGILEDFAQDLSIEERETMVATQGATQGAILGTPAGSAAWHTKPSWFVIASQDRTIAPEQHKFMAARIGAKTITLAASHVAMLAKPTEVAAFIAEAALSGAAEAPELVGARA
jgi:pimeloyl-ACP methyl ester carboxylesterase